MKRLFLILILLFNAAQAEEKVLIHHAKALVLTASPTDLLRGEQLQGNWTFKAQNILIPGGDKALAARLLPLYQNKSLTKEGIEKIKGEIYRYFVEHHAPLVAVQVPPQEVTSGVLQLVITQSKLEKVSVKGNEYSSTKRLTNWIELKPGAPINQFTLIKDLTFINRNPFRHVDLVYLPGEKKETTDILLTTEERRPYRFFVGTDDAGVRTTDRFHYFTGLNVWWPLWNTEQLFNYQYTAGYRFRELQAHTGQYRILLPWMHVATFYGGATFVKPKLSLKPSKDDGASYQASFRYTIPLNPWNDWRHEWEWGFDFKRTNNTFTFSEILLNEGAPVNLTQFAGRYGISYNGDASYVQIEAELFWSPGHWISDQTNHDYSALRPDAKNEWVYARGSFSYLQRLPKNFSLTLNLRGQLSSQNLLPSEQFGIGGYDTVRGYDERQLNKDGAFVLNYEVRTPPLRLWTRRDNNPSAKEALQFLVFFDYGLGSNHNPIPNEPTYQYLMSTGPGLRYTWDAYFAGRFDWGFKLHHNPLFSGGDSMFHFSAIASY